MSDGTDNTDNTDRRHDDAELRSDGLEARLRALREDVDILDQLVRDAIHPTPAEQAGAGQDGAGQDGARQDKPFALRQPTLADWVGEFFAPTFARAISPSVRWCARWWDHAEAMSRLEALWRTWEVLRLRPWDGVSIWYRDFLDPQLAVLLSPDGPFAQCTPDRHAPLPRLPVIPAPQGWWGDPDEPDGEALADDSPYR